MKIIIAGAGEVGTHLAKLLSQERQDIILMDPDDERLQNAVGSGFEIMPVLGNPTSIRDLEDAGIGNADLFIGVTPEETTNITACMLAANLGAQRTFARINNYEYLLPKNAAFFERLGVHSLIYPEMLAAKEIVAAVKRPWARQYWELCGGALILIGIKVRENAPIVDKSLSELFAGKKKYHVVAIKRDSDTIIPKGNDVILPGDIVFFATTREYLHEIRVHAGKRETEVKKVVIMGGSRIAYRATQYLPDNIRVRIIERDAERCKELAAKVGSNVMIIHGDGRDTELLKEEGLGDAEAFIALTDDASTNILACIVAKRYGVLKTIAQVENIDYLPLVEKFDIGAIINKKLIAASNIYQFLLDADVSNVKCLTFANADVAELVARPDSKITKKPVKDLNLPKDITLGGLIRDGVSQIVEGDTVILPQDKVVVFCLDTAMRKLENYFN
ncbi:MAG: Trk system potassium transporter TrkA [Bacteroidales bacterium]|nr:Trk system potassium transporter TrkA [Bacteroidales bacterium]